MKITGLKPYTNTAIDRFCANCDLGSVNNSVLVGDEVYRVFALRFGGLGRGSSTLRPDYNQHVTSTVAYLKM